MNRINAIMVYAVILIWTGIVLLHGISGIGFSTRATVKYQRSRIVAANHASPVPNHNPRLDSLVPLYY
ncbi:MAG: hypothetical protein RDU76_09715 [Candidatus Edwardsbacteria bacterium]|nr:hypothetical protein [Candidatus Edwardsbacteria bacterium]